MEIKNLIPDNLIPGLDLELEITVRRRNRHEFLEDNWNFFVEIWDDGIYLMFLPYVFCLILFIYFYKRNLVRSIRGLFSYCIFLLFAVSLVYALQGSNITLKVQYFFTGLWNYTLLAMIVFVIIYCACIVMKTTYLLNNDIMLRSFLLGHIIGLTIMLLYALIKIFL